MWIILGVGIQCNDAVGSEVAPLISHRFTGVFRGGMDILSPLENWNDLLSMVVETARPLCEPTHGITTKKSHFRARMFFLSCVYMGGGGHPTLQNTPVGEFCTKACWGWAGLPWTSPHLDGHSSGHTPWSNWLCLKFLSFQGHTKPESKNLKERVSWGLFPQNMMLAWQAFGVPQILCYTEAPSSHHAREELWSSLKGCGLFDFELVLSK